jgi:hypothetical protein
MQISRTQFPSFENWRPTLRLPISGHGRDTSEMAGTSRRPIPDSWREMVARTSIFQRAGSRNAHLPINAMLNYRANAEAFRWSHTVEDYYPVQPRPRWELGSAPRAMFTNVLGQSSYEPFLRQLEESRAILHEIPQCATDGVVLFGSVPGNHAQSGSSQLRQQSTAWASCPTSWP